jgi:hypothetical protein
VRIAAVPRFPPVFARALAEVIAVIMAGSVVCLFRSRPSTKRAARQAVIDRTGKLK